MDRLLDESSESSLSAINSLALDYSDNLGGPQASPVLPIELEREIFDTVAYLHSEAMPSLLLVCRRVYDWVTKIKYRTIGPSYIPSCCSFHELERGILSMSKPTSFFRDRVRHLHIPWGHRVEMRELLSTCSSVTALAVMIVLDPSVFSGLSVLRPRRANLALTSLLNHTNLCRSLFSCTTHLHDLDMRTFESNPTTDRWLSFLSLLPALTHLAAPMSPDLVPLVFASCKTLEILIYIQSFLGPSPFKEPDRFTDDERILYMIITWDYAQNWVTGVQGGTDFWVRADKFVAMRRRGQIKPCSRCWIEDEDGI
ncbi:hypothetical protein R3P38DRAFT_1633452 [Favolaschia claudopus]|uniref:F-box domain-containing protein n=1 Tax=Favolaschia claudopus TaxID=2862362 RepID=A0AAW0DKN2_9AGAR